MTHREHPNSPSRPGTSSRRANPAFVVTLAVAVALLLGSAPGARASTDTVEPVLVSSPGLDPGMCSPAFPPVRGADDEVSVTADPRDGNRLVAGWRSDGAAGAGAAWSDDHGRSWHRVILPELSRCSDRTEDQLHNVWVSTGPDGITYLVAKPGVAGGEVSDVAVTTSHDGGRTWTTPVRPQPLDGQYNDKPMVVADPVRPGTAYVAWRGDANVAANPVETILFSRTTDGGRTWSSPSVAHLSAPGAFESPHLIAFADGTLEDLIVTGDPVGRAIAIEGGGPGEPVTVLASRSTDEGTTWSPAHKVVTYTDTLPQAGNYNNSGGALFAAATQDQRAWIAYQDSSNGSSRPDRIRLIASTDAGQTWSQPQTITSGAVSFYPMVAATQNRVAVGFYDLRNTTSASTLTADVWVRESDDDGATWQERHVDGPFTYTGLHGGDYQSATAAGSDIGLAYTRPAKPEGNGPDDIYFAPVGPAGPVTADSNPAETTAAETATPTASTSDDTTTTGPTAVQTARPTASKFDDTITARALARTGANADLAIPAAFCGAAVAIQAANRSTKRARRAH